MFGVCTINYKNDSASNFYLKISKEISTDNFESQVIELDKLLQINLIVNSSNCIFIEYNLKDQLKHFQFNIN